MDVYTYIGDGFVKKKNQKNRLTNNMSIEVEKKYLSIPTVRGRCCGRAPVILTT